MNIPEKLASKGTQNTRRIKTWALLKILKRVWLYCLCPLVYMLPKIFKWLGYTIVWVSVYLDDRYSGCSPWALNYISTFVINSSEKWKLLVICALKCYTFHVPSRHQSKRISFDVFAVYHQTFKIHTLFSWYLYFNHYTPKLLYKDNILCDID
jgi:hypothetical protein